jgi:hypothetical protein
VITTNSDSGWRKANGLEPYQYLKHLFTELPKAKDEVDVQKLLPWQIDPLTLQ